MEKEQVSVLNELITILFNFENTLNHNVIFAGDFDCDTKTTWRN